MSGARRLARQCNRPDHPGLSHTGPELEHRSLYRLQMIDVRPPARYQTVDALIAFLTDR